MVDVDEPGLVDGRSDVVDRSLFEEGGGRPVIPGQICAAAATGVEPMHRRLGGDEGSSAAGDVWWSGGWRDDFVVNADGSAERVRFSWLNVEARWQGERLSAVVERQWDDDGVGAEDDG
jgi:hypothetical protein